MWSLTVSVSAGMIQTLLYFYLIKIAGEGVWFHWVRLLRGLPGSFGSFAICRETWRAGLIGHRDSGRCPDSFMRESVVSEGGIPSLSLEKPISLSGPAYLAGR